MRRLTQPARRGGTDRRSGLGGGRRWLLGLLLPTQVACQAADLRVEALPGCGLDVEPERLRVTARGDFPAEPQILDRDGKLAPLPDEVRALTVEGLVGDADVVAVGRTPELPERGTVPVYFAGVETLCAVPAGLLPRDPGAGAVVGGDAILVGGRDGAGALLAEVVIVRDTEEGAAVAGSLPVPSVGQAALPAPDGRLWVTGGAGPSGALATMVAIDPSRLPGDPVGDPAPILLDGVPQPVAHAAVYVEGDGALLVGGCSRTGPSGACEAGADALRAGSIRLDLGASPPAATAGPAPNVARRDAFLVAAEDGTLLLVGGIDGDGAAVHVIERAVGASWELLEPDLAASLGEPLPAVVGVAALHPDGLALALADGRLAWWSPHHVTWVDLPPELALPVPRRALTPVAGDRVLLDDFVLPLAWIDADLAGDQGPGVDPARIVRLTEVSPGARRVGALPLTLRDGTVLLAGGRVPEDPGTLVSGAFLRRYRPGLYGPDEGLPSLAAQPGLVAHHPQATAVDGALRLVALPAGSEDPRFPAVGAHVRGARGTRLRLDADLDPGGAGVRMMFWQGARRALSVGVGPGPIRLAARDGAGVVTDLACDGADAPDPAGRSLRVDWSPEEVRVFQDGAPIATCPGVELAGAVGVAAAGGGEVRLRNLRISRLAP